MGKFSLIALLLLCSCAGPDVSFTCSDVKAWTSDEEAAQAKAFSDLYSQDPNSPLVGPMMEWDRLRQEAKACAKNHK